MTRAERLKLLVLVLVVAGHLAAALWLTPDGYLGIDEVTYDLMLENLAAGRGLEVWNGYDELASPELWIASVSAARGRLVAQPPPFYPVLALPFYRWSGWRGAFVLSSLAFAGVLVCCWLLARSLHGRDVAWNATLILALATFLPGYAQAGWPHALSTLAVTAAVLAAWRALCATDGARLGWAALAGALCSLATGIRLDGVFVLPALLFTVSLERPVDWKVPVAVIAGAAPGLVLLGWLNHLKFGSYSPFSYGQEAGRMTGGAGEYLPVALLGAVVLVLLWVLATGGARRWRAGWLATAGGLAVSAVLLLPAWRRLAVAGLVGVLQLVIDLRWRPLSIVESVQERTASGAVVYLGGLKKSLLQSLPYLPVALVALWTGLRDRARSVWVLALPVLCYVGVYSAFAWHGGLAINLRYWTPILPFTSILAAAALRELRAPRRPIEVAAAASLAGLPLAAFLLATPSPRLAEPVLLTVPLLLAGLLLALAAWWCAAVRRPGSPLARGTSLATAAGLVWAAAVVHLHDMPWEARARRAAVEARARVTELVPRDSLLITPFVVALRSVAEGRRVRMADPTRDRYADFRRLAIFHLRAGRPVLAALRADIWAELGRVGALEGLGSEPVWEGRGIVLARLSLLAGGSGGSVSGPSGSGSSGGADREARGSTGGG